jgi:ERF superfamily
MNDTERVRPLRTSDSTANIAAALARAQAQFLAVSKELTAQIETKSGRAFSYTYADLPAIFSAIRAALTKEEIAVTQALQLRAHHLITETVLLHSSGEFLSSELALPISEHPDPRQIGSCATYGRRFGLCAMVGIAAQSEDDDAEAASAGTKTMKSRTRAPAATAVAVEERAPATPAINPPKHRPDSEPLNDSQRRKLWAHAKAAGWDESSLRNLLFGAFGIRSTKQLCAGDLEQALDLIRRKAGAPPPAAGASVNEEPF